MVSFLFLLLIFGSRVQDLPNSYVLNVLRAAIFLVQSILTVKLYGRPHCYLILRMNNFAIKILILAKYKYTKTRNLTTTTTTHRGYVSMNTNLKLLNGFY